MRQEFTSEEVEDMRVEMIRLADELQTEKDKVKTIESDKTRYHDWWMKCSTEKDRLSIKCSLLKEMLIQEIKRE